MGLSVGCYAQLIIIGSGALALQTGKHSCYVRVLVLLLVVVVVYGHRSFGLRVSLEGGTSTVSTFID